MGRTLDFQSQRGLEKRSWLFTRAEKDRYNETVARWKKENPNATYYQEVIGQQVIELRIMLQRLLDRRTFFFGESASLTNVNEHEAQLDGEDMARKQREWKEYYLTIQKELRGWIQLAIANSVNVELSADLSSMFTAMDATDRMKIRAFRGVNGEAENETGN